MKLPINYNEASYQERRIAREQYVKEQENRCYYCYGNIHNPPPSFVTEKPVDKSLFPEGFFNWPVHLHHDHKTGISIGAVHSYCNAVLWQYLGE